MSGLNIVSDFVDFYDTDESSGGVLYRRMSSERLPKGRALSKLKSIGIPIIDVGPVTKFDESDGVLVVYTDVNKHDGKGKRVCTYNEAVTQFRNFLASKYVERLNGVTVKMLQVGKRTYKLTYVNKNKYSFDMGELVSVTRGSDGYNNILKLPIYSVDYIWDLDGAAYAVDFNEVQNLEKLGFSNFMSGAEIRSEIIDAIEFYSK